MSTALIVILCVIALAFLGAAFFLAGDTPEDFSYVNSSGRRVYVFKFKDSTSGDNVTLEGSDWILYSEPVGKFLSAAKFVSVLRLFNFRYAFVYSDDESNTITYTSVRDQELDDYLLSQELGAPSTFTENELQDLRRLLKEHLLDKAA